MEILLGTNSPIRQRIFWKGESVDLDTNPTVYVYDVTEDPAVIPAIDPGTYITTLSTTKKDNDPGVYEVYLPLSITNRRRELNLQWIWNVDGESAEKTHKVFVVVPYVDIAQAADSIGISSDLSDPNSKTYAELLEAERYARKSIEAYTGQKFTLYNDVHVVYSNGSDILPLPYKLNYLHELYANDILLVDNINSINNWGYEPEITPSGFGIKVNRANVLDNTIYVANGLIPPKINDFGGVFYTGSSYKIQGKFGWDYVPDEVELACIELMKDYFSKDKTWRNKYIKNIQTFDWQFEYNSTTFSGTGNNYVDQLLLPYVLTKMVVI